MTSINRRTFVAFSSAVLTASPFIRTALGQKSEKKKVRIAYIGPLTGPNTSVGIGTRNSLELALRQTSASLEYQLELVSESDDSKPSTGVDAVKKVCIDPSIVAASAHWNSPVALATAQVFREYGMLNLISGAASDRLTRLNIPEIGRVVTPFRYFAPEIAARAWEEGLRRIVVVKSRDDYGTDMAKSFAEHFLSLGGQIVGEESYNVGDRDFSAICTNARTKRPDGLLFAGLSTEAALFIRQARQFGISAQLLGHPGFATKAFLDAAGPAAEGALSVTLLPFPEELPGGPKFLQDYDAAGFSDPPEVLGMFGYATGQVLVELIRRHGPERKSIVAGLRQLTDVETILGKVSFDEEGEMQPKRMGMAIAKSGEWKLYAPARSVTRIIL